MCTVSFSRRVGECVAEGGARGDAELGEDLVEVGGDRSWGEEEAGGDLLVGVACRSEQGDLALLGGEGGQAGVGGGDGDAGGAQFTGRAGRPGGCAEPAEGFRGGGQLAAGVGGALDAAQVGAVGELDAGQVEGPAVVARFGDCPFEGGGVGPWFGDGLAGEDDQAQPWGEPVEAAVAGGGGVGRGLTAAAGVDGGFDEVEEHPQGVRGVGGEGAGWRNSASMAEVTAPPSRPCWMARWRGSRHWESRSR